MSIDHNLPPGLDYIASRPPGVERSISCEPHHVFRVVMASPRLHRID